MTRHAMSTPFCLFGSGAAEEAVDGIGKQGQPAGKIHLVQVFISEPGDGLIDVLMSQEWVAFVAARCEKD